MFDIGFGEMLLLGAIALIAIGPKQLPEVARTVGRFLSQVRRVGGDWQRSFIEASHSPERAMGELKKTWDQAAVDTQELIQISTEVRAVAKVTAEAVKPESVKTENQDTAQLSLTDSPQVALDEHRQMSFDFDKSES